VCLRGVMQEAGDILLNIYSLQYDGEAYHRFITTNTTALLNIIERHLNKIMSLRIIAYMQDYVHLLDNKIL
jgi:hypothetical protein